jgi:hypothetical protein
VDNFSECFPMLASYHIHYHPLRPARKILKHVINQYKKRKVGSGNCSYLILCYHENVVKVGPTLGRHDVSVPGRLWRHGRRQGRSSFAMDVFAHGSKIVWHQHQDSSDTRGGSVGMHG